MKRTVALAILGVAAATTAYGQGDLQLGNYFSPYVPTVYSGGAMDGQPIHAGDGVIIGIWGAAGAGLAEDALQPVGTFTSINSTYAGYYGPQLFTLSTWGGEDWTLQYRAIGTAGGEAVDLIASRGGTFTVAGDQIVTSGGTTPPNYIKVPESSFTVVVPEPTTFALAGLGAAALLIFRRRD